jgi:SAM-dependent methyltransferase
MAAAHELSDADHALKAAHRAMWASGDYPALADAVIPDLGAALVAACAIQRGDRVLDVATGAGNAAIPAASALAHVTACDLTPELLEAGRRAAAAAGVEVTWREADAEALPFTDGEFDVVLSSVGVMFAPHHPIVADELARVCRPGGTIGLASWSPQGFVGEMFAAMKPFVPAPPPGAQPPLRWGDESYVRGLFGDRISDVSAELRNVAVECFDEPAAFRESFKTRYGPTLAAYRGIADDPARVAALDAALDDLAARNQRPGPGCAMEWEYLLFTARRRAPS